MNDMRARTYVVSYLKERNIFYQNIRGGSSLLVGLTGLEYCPGELLESLFDFYQTCLEARVYFSESVSEWLTKRPIDGRSCTFFLSLHSPCLPLPPSSCHRVFPP